MIIFPQAFPWAMHVGVYGPGTAYPAQTGMHPTHRIYWNTRTLIMSGTISGDQGAAGDGSVVVSGVSEPRAQNALQLINPIGGRVDGGGGDDGSSGSFTGLATFTFSAGSGGPVHDFNQQYLAMAASGEFRRTDSGGDTFVEMIFTSVPGPDYREIGTCTFEGFSFPLFTKSPGTMNVDLAITRTPLFAG